MKLLAFDTETYLIAPRSSVPQGAKRVLTSPYVTPKLVLGSTMTDEPDNGGPTVHSPASLRDTLLEALNDPDTHLVAHHFPFDCDVVCTAYPELWAPFRAALNTGRCHDTKLLDILYGLASGYYDRPEPHNNWKLPEVLPRSLDTLAQMYLGVQVPKDHVDDAGDVVRLSFHKWDGVPIAQIPECYVSYAAQDAAITLRLFERLRSSAPDDLWGEPAQVRAEVALYAFDKVGMRIDRAEAKRLQELFSQDMPALQQALVDHGLGEWLPLRGTRTVQRYEGELHTECADGWGASGGVLTRTRRFKKHWTVESASPAFHLFQKEVRDALERLAAELCITPKRTDSGMISLVAEDWKDRVPSTNAPLTAYLKHERLKKILGTYLNLYAQCDEVYPKTNALRARSGRTSASLPNYQNVSKNKHGIRSLFVPREGLVFVRADYAFQELVTLAQAMLDLGIKGNLYRAIQIGDPHTATARLILGLPEKETIEWPMSVSAQLDACSQDESLPKQGVGSLTDTLLTNGGIVSSPSEARASWLTARLGGYGWEPFLTECSSVIPVTTLRALIQSTFFSAITRPTWRMLLEKVECGYEIRVRDLVALIGREASRTIVRHTTELGRSDIPTVVTKSQRQSAKALNFGAPGGLGAAKLADYARKTYGVVWTLEEARDMRNRFLGIYPDINEYLDRHKTSLDANLKRVSGRGIDYWKAKTGAMSLLELRTKLNESPHAAWRHMFHTAEHCLEVRLRTGFTRSGCIFTEGSNSRFQGLAASVSKEAVWRFHSAPEARELGARVMMLVHDELVVECPPDAVAPITTLLEICMLGAFRDVCPDTGPFAKVEIEGPLLRWGKATDASGNAI